MVCSLITQHAKRMLRIISSSVVCPAAQRFPTLSFPHYLINGTTYGKKKILSTKCVFWFSAQLLSENICHSINNWGINYHKCNYVFVQSTRYSNQILMKLEMSLQFFEKYSYITFHEKNPSRGSRVIPRGQTDMTKLTVAFRYFVNVV